jgi:hypothetical protein
VTIQVIGDEALYGRNYIIEPSRELRSGGTPNPGYKGNKRVVVRDYSGSNLYRNDIVYVNSWPIVVHLYSPSFIVYISPWYWGYYPLYWRTWTPLRFSVYWNFHSHYYKKPYYRRTAYLRQPARYSYYLKRRNESQIVNRNRSNGSYNSIYEGRNYRRAETPGRRTVRPETRQSVPGTRTPRSVNPSVRQPNPSVRPSSRPSGSTRRQTTPSARPSGSSRNQATPSSRPSGSSRRQTTPSTRP